MRLYDKALVAKIHENQFTKEVDGIPVLFKPVPDAEPAHLDPRLREIIIKKRTMFANRAKAGWTLSSERYRPDKVTYDLIETPVDCTEQLIPIGGHKIDIYIYRIANIQPNAPVLVYLHGGGFTAGDIHLFGKQMQYIAEPVPWWCSRSTVWPPRTPSPLRWKMHGAPYSGCTHTPLNWVPTLPS